MDNALTSRATLVGHSTLTVPAIAAILLVPFFGLRMFGPFLFFYYDGYRDWMAVVLGRIAKLENLANEEGR